MRRSRPRRAEAEPPSPSAADEPRQRGRWPAASRARRVVEAVATRWPRPPSPRGDAVGGQPSRGARGPTPSAGRSRRPGPPSAAGRRARPEPVAAEPEPVAEPRTDAATGPPASRPSGRADAFHDRDRSPAGSIPTRSRSAGASGGRFGGSPGSGDIRARRPDVRRGVTASGPLTCRQGRVLAWPERHIRGARQGTGVRLDGSLRQVHGSRAQGPDAGAGRGAAVQPQLHRHGAPAPRPRPRGRGRRRARPREHERRAGQGPDRGRVHHRPRGSPGRRRGRPDAARQAGHRARDRRGAPPRPQLHRHGAPAPGPRPRGRGHRRRASSSRSASTSTRSATRSSASCRSRRRPAPPRRPSAPARPRPSTSSGST